jgi:uncharacterized protein (TIGR03435 family)
MLTVAAIAPLRAVARPQATALVADQALTYEVVSIRRSPSNALGSNGSNERPDGGLTLLNVPIRTLISRGYPDLAPIDMVGLPNWAISERFDVRATSPLSTATPEQRAAMMRAMLADRVGLVAHIETREQQVYDMVLARADRQLGPAIRPSEVDCVARDAADRAAREAALAAGDPPPPPVPPPFRPGELAPPCSRTRLGTGWEGDFTMAMLSQLLRGDTGRTVIDRTGLAGSYRLSLTFERSVAGRGPDVTPGPDGLPSLFSAIQDQLGLKLEPATAPRETLVIDRLERPTEN